MESFVFLIFTRTCQNHHKKRQFCVHRNPTEFHSSKQYIIVIRLHIDYSNLKREEPKTKGDEMKFLLSCLTLCTFLHQLPRPASSFAGALISSSIRRRRASPPLFVQSKIDTNENEALKKQELAQIALRKLLEKQRRELEATEELIRDLDFSRTPNATASSLTESIFSGADYGL
jgi:hypothetical protein